MAVTGKRLVSGSQIAASLTTYYTAPASTRARIDKCTVTNTTATSATFDLHLVPSGGSADATNQIVEDKAIAPDETYIVSEAIGHWLEPAGFIRAIASAATTLTLVVSGVEVT